MKPFYTVIFILTIFAMLAAISLSFPAEGISLAGKKFIFPKLDDFFKKDTVKYADISNILEQSDIYNQKENKNDHLTDSIDFNLLTDNNRVSKDTLAKPDTSLKKQYKKADAKQLRKNITKIQFPNDDPSALYPVFSSFLKAKTSKEPARILHFGDSQIEGDRISSFLRDKFQRQFGGSGMGLLPPVQPYNYQFSVKQTSSPNWLRWTVFGKRDKTLNHNRYGLLASFGRFTSYNNDNILAEDEYKEAWISFEPSYISYRSVRQYKRCKIFLGYNKKALFTEVLVNGQLLDADILYPEDKLQVLKWDFKETPKKLTLKFKGADSPEVYAIALDDQHGVAVDNIPMRGSAGLIFTKVDQALFKQILSELNVNMIILQYGGNVVPYMKSFSRYEKLFFSQLQTLKQMVPGVPIIIIGPADMSINKEGVYTTHPSVEKVRDALKRAAFSAGCGYWDMYEAMGGFNSMPSWVYATPSLAATDFIHFNQRGAKIIAEMFYNALMQEFNTYLEKSYSKNK